MKKNEEATIIFQTEESLNPFRKDLINEFKDKSEADEVNVEEITRNLLNDIMNDCLSPILVEKGKIFHKLKQIFLKKPNLIFVNNEKISFKLSDDEEISLALFQNKHINEIYKYMYNSLIEMVFGIFKYFYFILFDINYLFRRMGRFYY